MSRGHSKITGHPRYEVFLAGAASASRARRSFPSLRRMTVPLSYFAGHVGEPGSRERRISRDSRTRGMHVFPVTRMSMPFSFATASPGWTGNIPILYPRASITLLSGKSTVKSAGSSIGPRAATTGAIFSSSSRTNCLQMLPACNITSTPSNIERSRPKSAIPILYASSLATVTHLAHTMKNSPKIQNTRTRAMTSIACLSSLKDSSTSGA